MSENKTEAGSPADSTNKGTLPSGITVSATKTPTLSVAIREKPRVLVYITPAASAQETVDLHADVSHEGAGGITWTSADATIANVVGSGGTAYVYGLKPGVTTVTATYSGWGQNVTDTIEVVAYRVIIDHPKGDPKFAGSATNEFTFTDANVGVLTVNCRAKVEPDDADARAEAEPRIRWSMDAVGKSELKWTIADPIDPTKGQGINTSAVFKGLPLRYDDFGVKTVSLTLDGSSGGPVTASIEVFWPKYATNHPPDGLIHLGGTSPNWFYYWRQVIGEGYMKHCRYGGGNPNFGVAPAMYDWKYGAALVKRRIVIYDTAADNDPGLPETHGPVTGIDCFYNTFLHESVHVDQISKADPVVGIVPGTCWANGWSWNQPDHNHWRLGPGRVANAGGVCTPAGPGTMGSAGSGDVLLNDATERDWPTAWGAVPPGGKADGTYIGDFPIEQPAYLAEKSPEHAKAKWDWGAPGKNHRTRNKWDD